jgi:hypothetical protein
MPKQKRASSVAQGVGPEFKPQHCKTTTTTNAKNPGEEHR